MSNWELMEQSCPVEWGQFMSMRGDVTSQVHASVKFSSVQLLSHVQLSATPWTAACQASLSITNSRSLLKLASIESVMPSNHLVLCCPLLLLPSCSVQFSSVAQSCPTLCDPMNRSTPGLPVHHQLTEFTQTHVHRVSDAIQPSHPRSSDAVSFSSKGKGTEKP